VYLHDHRGSEVVAMPSSAQARRFYRAAKQRFDDALLLLEMEALLLPSIWRVTVWNVCSKR
jgi:hypothetical protein